MPSRCVATRDQRVPDGVHVQNGARLRPRAIEHEVQPGLGGGLAVPAKDAPSIHFEQVGRVQRAFVQPARR